MTTKELQNEISAGKFRSLYYFYGADDFRMLEAERFLARSFLPKEQLLVNYNRIDGHKTKCVDLIARLSVYPMLGESQLLSVTDFQSYKPTEVDKLLKLLRVADPNRIIILSTPASKTPKKKSALLKKISSIAPTVYFDRLDARDAAIHIRGKLAKVELSAEPEAISLLIQLVNGSLGALDVEIKKLGNYKESGEVVTADDVRAVGCGYQTYEIFKLAEEVVKGDKQKVLTMVHRFLADGSSPTGMLYFLGQHFLSLYIVKGGKPLEAKRRWLTRNFHSQAGKYSFNRLEEIIKAVASADSSLRRKSIKPELILDQLVLGMMTERPV